MLTVASEVLGLTVEERPVALDELGEFSECGLCGTAAVISPVGKIVNGDTEYVFGMQEMGPYTKKLYDTLRGIQMGEMEGPKGWIRTIVE